MSLTAALAVEVPSACAVGDWSGAAADCGGRRCPAGSSSTVSAPGSGRPATRTPPSSSTSRCFLGGSCRSSRLERCSSPASTRRSRRMRSMIRPWSPPLVSALSGGGLRRLRLSMQPQRIEIGIGYNPSRLPRRELQVVEVRAMLIACKYEKIRAPEVNDAPLEPTTRLGAIWRRSQTTPLHATLAH